MLGTYGELLAFEKWIDDCEDDPEAEDKLRKTLVLMLKNMDSGELAAYGRLLAGVWRRLRKEEAESN